MDSDGPSTVSLTIDSAAWQAVVADPEELCRQVISATLRHAAPATWRDAAEVSVLLCDDARIRALNRSWRGQDRPTNVLSFPALELDPERAPPASPRHPLLLGDVVLAAETVHSEAAAQGKRPADHLRHLLVHGCLHLFGHDHQAPGEALRMERLERLILAELGIADPYGGTGPGGGEGAALAEMPA
jgi:probable rRNA maturation factor